MTYNSSRGGLSFKEYNQRLTELQNLWKDRLLLKEIKEAEELTGEVADVEKVFFSSVLMQSLFSNKCFTLT
jgi:hypothetical protein